MLLLGGAQGTGEGATPVSGSCSVPSMLCTAAPYAALDDAFSTCGIAASAAVSQLTSRRDPRDPSSARHPGAAPSKRLVGRGRRAGSRRANERQTDDEQRRKHALPVSRCLNPAFKHAFAQGKGRQGDVTTAVPVAAATWINAGIVRDLDAGNL